MAKERKFVSLQAVVNEKGHVDTMFAIADDGTAWVAKYSLRERNVRPGEDWSQINPLPQDQTQ